MYKLNIDHVNEVKYENTPQHGLFSGTIETDRVVLVDGDGKYLQVDGNFGTDLKIGLVRTYSATRDEAEIAYKIATTDATTYAAVYCYADIMVLQSAYADVDAFIDYLVSEGVITIEGYVAPETEPTDAGKGLTLSAPKKDDKSDSESKEEPEVAEIKEDEVEVKSDVEQKVEQEVEPEVESEPDLEPESKPEEK